MQKSTKTLVTTVSYLLGLDEEKLLTYYNLSEIEKLKANENATIVRSLCRVRTQLFKNFAKTDKAIINELKNLDNLNWFDKNDIQYLTASGYDIIKANYRAEKYLYDISTLINILIEDCDELFYDWQRFDYIKECFKIPKINQPDILKNEFKKYTSKFSKYPYGLYMNWDPISCGNLLLNDEKFLRILFELHGSVFLDEDKCNDATDTVKNMIYDFINKGNNVMLAVDCENVDVFKIMSMLYNLSNEETKKISRIILYDDPKTSVAWDYIENHIHIPIEHIEVNRVINRKSLVDIRMTADICKLHYSDNVDSFLLASSDSDCWGLVESLPNAKFLMLYETEKCSPATQKTWDKHNYQYCCIDEFCMGQIETLRNEVVINQILSQLPDLSNINLKTIYHNALVQSKITMSQKEMDMFYNKHIKDVRVQINSQGLIEWDFPN
jgi:uncharacterized LabA/DUF88 family protein